MSFSVVVTRNELLSALQTLAGVVDPKRASEAVLTLANGVLSIELPGASVSVPAEGLWPGSVRVPGQFFLALARVPPKDDPFHLSVRDGRFRISKSSTLCLVEETRRGNIDVALDAPLYAIVRVGLAHDDSEIDRSGLGPLVREARERRDNLVEAAAKTLSPLGVSADDLSNFVDDFILRKTK
jgi:hypothetical protein